MKTITLTSLFLISTILSFAQSIDRDVVASASNMSFVDYFNDRLKNPIGMSGAWLPSGDFNVYWSTTRSMARFGLLIYANGI